MFRTFGRRLRFASPPFEPATRAELATAPALVSSSPTQPATDASVRRRPLPQSQRVMQSPRHQSTLRAHRRRHELLSCRHRAIARQPILIT